MNLPNKLTMLRLALTAVFVAVTSLPLDWAFTAGLFLFIAASITDWMDGAIARSRGLVTTFGKLMDPLADKILMCSTFVVLAVVGLIPGWAVIIILSREFLVTGLRLIATSQGAILAADAFGKWKTILQVATAIYFLLHRAAAKPPLSWLNPLFDLPGFRPEHLGHALLGITVLLTVLSGFRYLRDNRHLLKDA